MLDFIALGALTLSALLLLALSLIDLKTRLLPDKLVFPFALLAPVFHAATGFSFLSPLAMIGGGLLCGGLLYAIRAMANRIYKTDTLGLGDVKLMGAAGLWLGPEIVMLSLSAGAAAGLVHGVTVALYSALKNKEKPQFKGLKIPAGPGLAVGIVIGGFILLQDFHPF